MNKKIKYKFVEFIPEELESDTLYVSLKYEVAVHKCFCGCENKVVTPFSGNGWKFVFFNGEVSLEPSIGNYNLACKSHYFIKNGEIQFV